MNLLKLWTTRAALALIVALVAVGLAYSFPFDLAVLMAIDLGTWVEAAVAVYVVAQVTKVRPIIAHLRLRFCQRRSRREVRTVSRGDKITASDSDPEPRLLLAA